MKITQEIYPKYNIDFEQQCKLCQAKLRLGIPQYYCEACNNGLCESCREKVDINQVGIYMLMQAHCMAYMNVKSNAGLFDLNGYKFG